MTRTPPPFDGRPTIRLVNSMPDHEKVVKLSDKAFRLFIEAICYCSRMETNGRITDAALKRMTTPRIIRELVEAGLLETGDGWHEVHDYLKHQRSAEEVAAFRQSRSESGTYGAHMRWHVPTRTKKKDCDHCMGVKANA